MSVYLDHNASTPMRPEAVEALLEALSPSIGNPNAIHSHGRAGHRLVEDARTFISRAMGLPVLHTVFTGGGSEAISLAVFSLAALSGKPRFLISSIEHEAVRRAVEETGKPFDVIEVTRDGVLDLSSLDGLLARAAGDGFTPIVCVMSANNITGVIQPLAEVSERVREQGGFLFVDATQSVGKGGCNFGALGVDMVAMSAHKFGGPQGIGCLCAANRARPLARVFGGGQERGFRAGTQGTALIHAMAAAMKAALCHGEAEQERLQDYRTRFESGLKTLRNDLDILGEGAPRLCHVCAFIVPHRSGQQLAIALDLAGVSVSAGTACSSGKLKPDSVALAMGRDEAAAQGVIRVSFGWNSQDDDVSCILRLLNKHIAPVGAATN